MDTIEAIKQQISANPIILYMKGSPNQPQCGFSARASQALMECGERFAFVDILSNPDIRAKCPSLPIGRRFHSCGLLASWLAAAILFVKCTKAAS